MHATRIFNYYSFINVLNNRVLLIAFEGKLITSSNQLKHNHSFYFQYWSNR